MSKKSSIASASILATIKKVGIYHFGTIIKLYSTSFSNEFRYIHVSYEA